MKIKNKQPRIIKMANGRKPSSGGSRKPGSSNQPPEGPQWGKASRSLIFWIGIFIIAMLISQQFTGDREKQTSLNYNDFIQMLESGQIQEITVEGKVINGKLKPTGDTSDKQGAFKLILLAEPDYAIIENWRTEYGITMTGKQSSPSFVGILMQIVPWLLFIGLWVYFLRRMQGGGGGQRGIFNFGKSKARMVSENFPKVTFADVAGADEAKQELQEII